MELDLLTEAVLVERHEAFRRDLAALYAGTTLPSCFTT